MSYLSESLFSDLLWASPTVTTVVEHVCVGVIGVVVMESGRDELGMFVYGGRRRRRVAGGEGDATGRQEGYPCSLN
jgi:hypothetical protein